MLAILPPLRLTGADILRDGMMQRRSLSFADGRITRGPFPEVDLSGFLVLPGIVDLQVGPLVQPAEIARLDADCAAAGVTTALAAVEWGWQSPRHAPETAQALLAALQVSRPGLRTDMQASITSESRLVDEGARLIDTAARHRPALVVFADTLHDLHEMRRTAPHTFAAHAHGIGTTAEALSQAADAAAQRTRDMPRHLCRLADAFDTLGLIYGSRNDPDGETRERHQMIGARVALFPATRQAAAAARAMMSPVLLRAADANAGRTGSGLLAAGLGEALASDAARPMLAQAAWAAVDAGLLALPRAWAMISERPAEILRLADRGRLDPGLRADLTIVNAATRAVEATISAGRLVHVAGEAARRFSAAALPLRIAAE